MTIIHVRDLAEEANAAYSANPEYGPGYVRSTPFYPRPIEYVPAAVARAAADTGVGRRPIPDTDAYQAETRVRLDQVWKPHAG